MKKHQLKMTICLGLMLAMLITAIPFAFGQAISGAPATAGNAKVAISTLVDVKPWDISIGQSTLVQGLLYPPPAYDVPINITLTAPNGTKIVKPFTLTGDIKECWFTFTPDAVGIWNAAMSYAGDSGTTSSTSTFRKVLTVHPASDPQPLPPTTRPTKAYVGTVPLNKVGVGDAIYIVGWVSPPRELQGGIFHTNFVFTITKPDGSVDTVSKKPDSPATASFSYVCATAGTYSVKMSFAGDSHLVFFSFGACESQTTTWVAEAGYKAAQYPGVPLPAANVQWKYPVSQEYYEWYQITGAWPQSTYDASQSWWNPYTTAPNTPHVIWRYVVSPAGIMGGTTGYLGFTGGSAVGSISWQGYVWTTGSRLEYINSTSSFSVPTLIQRDMFTGQVVKTTDLPGTSASLSFLELQAREKIDPRQSESIGQATNLWVTGNGGIYTVNPFTGAASSVYTGVSFSSYYNGKIYSVTTNATTGHSYLAAWDTGVHAFDWTNVDLGDGYRTGDFIDTSLANPVYVRSQVDYGGWPVNTKLSSWNLATGALIVDGQSISTIQSPEGAPGREEVGWGNYYIHGDDLKVHAISETTGKEVWASAAQIYPWGDFNAYNTARGYNIIYFNSWDGHVYGYDAASGATVMSVYSADAYQETAMGTYPMWGNTMVADNKIYVATSQHTSPNPYPRGDSLICANAKTGEKIWQLFGISGGGGLIASGVLIKTNNYDGATYAFAKGPSAVTVSAPETAVPVGTPMLIQGTVTDQSPGSPNTPAVSDASQAQWVNYLYMNKPIPTNATGVPVVLRAVSNDGVVTDLGTVTSDILGHFELAWTPSTTGTYKILASFDGSEAYYSSSSETAALVSTASGAVASPTPVQTVAPTETPVTSTSPGVSPSPIIEQAIAPLTLIVAVAAIIIIVVAAVVALSRRKKK